MVQLQSHIDHIEELQRQIGEAKKNGQWQKCNDLEKHKKKLQAELDEAKKFLRQSGYLKD